MEDGDSLYARIAELEKQLEAEKRDDMCEEAYREGRKKRNDFTFLKIYYYTKNRAKRCR